MAMACNLWVIAHRCCALMAEDSSTDEAGCKGMVAEGWHENRRAKRDRPYN